MSKEQMIEKLYFDWLDSLECDFEDEVEAYQNAVNSVSILDQRRAIEHADAINDYGATVQKNAFINGFETAIKLLIGGEFNE